MLAGALIEREDASRPLPFARLLLLYQELGRGEQPPDRREITPQHRQVEIGARLWSNRAVEQQGRWQALGQRGASQYVQKVADLSRRRERRLGPTAECGEGAGRVEPQQCLRRAFAKALVSK